MKNYIKQKSTILLVVCCITSGIAFAQKLDFKKVTRLIEQGRNYDAIKILESFEKKKIKKVELAQTYFYLGKAYGNENSNDKSFDYFIKSERIYTSLHSIDSVMKVKIELADGLTVEGINLDTAKKYYQEYINYAEKKQDSKLITHGYYRMGSFLLVDKPYESRKFFFKALKANKKTNDQKAYSDIIFNLAALYSEKLNQRDSALFYYRKSLAIAQKIKNPDDICLCFISIAGVHYYQQEYQKSIKLLLEAEKVPITLYTKNVKSRIHYMLALNYYESGEFQKAFDELSLSQDLRNEHLFEEQNSKISVLQNRYETKEKELENLNLKVRNKNSRLLIFMFVALLVIVSFVGYLRINFLNKKKKIAEQEKLIESQKLENVLKEQELKEIDKLLEGQEKERIKIANDLHDNLGSLMATLKLNFENLKLRKDVVNEDEEQLFTKTDALIEEAYQKVRGIAHSKNAGVIANQGLLTAVMNIAQKVSIPGKLQVQVIPFGLDERLDNALEVTTFRMIQEILTNAIKHAEASEITIQLTQHQDNLNIIVEDNGKGFNAKILDKKDGMGLSNIEKRVEQLGGTFTIDSTEGRGTSILIDIPL